MHNKRVAREEEKTDQMNLKVGAAEAHLGWKTKESDGIKEVENVHKQPQNLEMCIQYLKMELSVYMGLIISNLSILNIFNY